MRLALFLSGVLLVACLPEAEPALTDPCTADCNESATVGGPCVEATDCAAGDACRTDFPGGYCQGFCEGSVDEGTPCGNDESGVCVQADGIPVCVGRCDPADPASCGRDVTACYELATVEGVGICHVRCASGADCSDGYACDGQGLCRPPVQTCDGLTDAGCADGTHCYLSAQGVPFCGLAGEAGRGAACSVVAGCVAGHWCIQGACRAKCDIDDFAACGGVPADCTPLVSGTRLGFCVR